MNNLSKLTIVFIVITWGISYALWVSFMFALVGGGVRIPCYFVKVNIAGIYVYLTTRNAGLVGGLFSGGVFSGSSSS